MTTGLTHRRCVPCEAGTPSMPVEEAERLVEQVQGWALSIVRTPESIAALWEALNDPEDLVRHHAATSLLEMHGIPSEDYDPHALTIKIMRTETQQEAIAELRKLI